MGILTGMPSVIFGLTVLTWGNSICDLTANSAVARSGFAEMAITGCYSGPLFNTLLGIGISSLKLNFT